MASLQLFFLGPPRIEVDGQALKVGNRKAMAMLAYLAVTANAHSRETLAALFWPESGHASARNSLRYTLSVLKKALGDEGLQIDREVITLQRAAIQAADVTRFHDLLAECQTHGHPANEVCIDCLAPLATAAKLYQADFLAGFTLRDCPGFDEWQAFETEELRCDLAGVLQRLVQLLGEHGQYDPAIAFARRCLALDPLYEPAHQQLMLLYALNRQQAAALAQYRNCLRVLTAELGADPAPETTALYRRIQAGEIEPPPPAVRPSESPAQPLASPAQDFASAAALPVRPFVGREREIEHLDARLRKALAGQEQVVFVTGGAGRGKTALLHQFALRAQEAHSGLVVAMGSCSTQAGIGDPYLPFRDVLGMFTGDLEAGPAAGNITQRQARRLWKTLPFTVQALIDHGPELIDIFVPAGQLLARALAAAPARTDWLAQFQTLAHSRQQTGDVVEQRHLFEQYTRVLRVLAARNPLVVVLDDLQWADAASISLLFHLGRRIMGSRIMILGAYRPDEIAARRGDAPHPLEKVLAEFKRYFGDIHLDLRWSGETEARKFVDALLDTQLNCLGQDFRQRLCHHTGGHPLFTIELLRHMEYAGNLIQNEQGYWGVSPSLNWEALPPQVEGVIEERIQRLDAELQELLAIAAVEGEQFTAQVLAQVQGFEEAQVVKHLADTLGRRYRLVQEIGVESVNGQRIYRYRFLHVLFQHYLYTHLTPAWREVLHARIGQALETLYRGRTHRVAMQLAQHFAEAGQAVKAVDYLLEAGERARRLYAYQEAIGYFQQALALLPHGTTPAREAERRLRLYEGLAEILQRQARYAEAEDMYTRLLLLSEATANHAAQAMAWLGLSTVQDRMGAPQTALQSAQQAEKIAQATGLQRELITAMLLQSWSFYKMGDAQAALALSHNALARSRELVARREMARSLNTLGAIQDMLGQYEEALQHKQEALALFRALGYRRWEGRMLGNLGNTELLRGDYNTAVSYYQAALAIVREVGDQDNELLFLVHLAGAQVGQGAYRIAEADLNQVIDLAEDASWMGLSLAYYFLAEARLGQGHVEDALAAAQRALKLARETGRQEGVGAAWRCLGMIAAKGRRSVEVEETLHSAAECFAKSLRIFANTGADAEHAQTLLEWARFEIATGDPGQGQAMWQEACDILARLGIQVGQHK